MSKINTGRMLIGGLLAGLIINIGEIVLNVFILAEDWAEANQNLGLPASEGTGMIVWYIILGFLLGLIGVWIYAAIRPRYGAGPRTAFFAGSTVWFLVYIAGFSGIFFSGLYPMTLFWWTMIWGFVEINLAMFIGARFYVEEE